MAESSPHLRLVGENFITHEEQILFLRFLVRDEDVSDEMVLYALLKTVIANEEELEQVLGTIQEYRPGVADLIGKKIGISNSSG